MKIINGVKRATVVLAISCMLLPQTLLAQGAIDESPNAFAMVGDLLVARPLGAVITVGGAAVWVVGLPFTLVTGHAGEAADTLIGGPFEETFLRCLGCRNTGYTHADRDAIAAREAAEKGPEPDPADF